MLSNQRLRLEALNLQHVISGFDCGNDELNAYLREDALTDMAKDVARTFVEIDTRQPATNNVAGFFTLRADTLQIDENYFDDWQDDVKVKL